MPDQHQHVEWPGENCTLEEFSRAIDDAAPADCSFCPSLGRMKPLRPLARQASWFDYLGKEEERQAFVLNELDRAQTRPFDDEVYQLVLQSELWKTDDTERLARLSKLLQHYAEVMVTGKMKSAWVAVRAYAWNKGFDPITLLKFAELIDDKDVLQVVLQCSFNCSLPYWENQTIAKQIRDSVAELTLQAILKDREKLYVPAVNGVLALMSFQDERAFDLREQLGRSSLQRRIEETATQIKSYVRERGQDQSFFVVLDKMTNSQ